MSATTGRARLLILVLLLGCAKEGSVPGAGTDPQPQADAEVADAMPIVAPDAGPQEVSYTLRINDVPPPSLTLDMDKGEVTELLGGFAEDTILLEIEARPLLYNTLERVKQACGDEWMLDIPEPELDCDLTELGRSFTRAGRHWRESPEYLMVRLLTMTPANAVVEGTSIDFLQDLADALNIGGGFGTILASSLGIERTQEFLDTDSVVDSLVENMLATHPAIIGGRRIGVTLQDALEDMAPLRQKLGPQGDHPGIVNLGFVPHSEVFGSDFRMVVVADSNLRIMDGIHLGVGVDNLAVIADTTGPTFDDAMEFDFHDPERFKVEGLVDRPVLDLRFSILEADRFVPACAGDEACKLNGPDNPVGVNTAWRQAPWVLERIVAFAGVLKYGDLRTRTCSIACTLDEVSVGQDPDGDGIPDPPGWAHFAIGAAVPGVEDLVPLDQYVWELINEVTQVYLHGPDERDFREGDADVEFTLLDVPVGITGEEAEAATRPLLQAQSRAIADFLLGDFRQNSGHVDFYFRRADDGTPALFFVHPDDIHADRPYTWRTQGFFADPGLSEKVSELAIDGVADGVHEKLVVQVGETIVYAQNDKGEVWRLRIWSETLAPTEITVTVSKVSP